MSKSKISDKPLFCVFHNGRLVGVFVSPTLARETCEAFPGSSIKIISWSLVRRLMSEKGF